MSSETRTVKAACFCGSAKYDITLPASNFPLKADICHCWSCRHMTGTLHLTLINMPEDWDPPKDVVDKLVPFKFSERLTQYHCNTCGSQLLAHNWKDGNDHSKGYSWDAMSGCIEKADGVFEISSHEFVGDTLDGGFADFLPAIDGKTLTRWKGWPGESDELPVHWSSPDRQQAQPKPDDRVRARCKCGGVEFWVARASERSKNASGAWPDLLIPHHSNQQGPGKTAWWLRDNDTKFLGGVCSCNSCRLDTGMEWIEWAFVPTVDVTLDAEGSVPYKVPFGTLKGYQSSADVTRYFCGTCGASTFFTSTDRPNLIDVAIGLLDSPEGARAESWLHWRTQRLSFREDALPRAEALTLGVESGLEEYGKRRDK